MILANRRLEKQRKAEAETRDAFAAAVKANKPIAMNVLKQKLSRQTLAREITEKYIIELSEQVTSAQVDIEDKTGKPSRK